MTRKQEIKIAAVIVLLGFTSALFVFSGSTAAFPPSHAAQMDTITDLNTLHWEKSATPGFHLYGAMILETLDISALYIMKTPFIIFAIAPIFYMLARELSGSRIIAASFTAVRLVSGNTGTGKHFLYSHGLANVLYLLLLTIILLTLRRRDFKWQIKIIMLLLLSSTMSLSYDIEAILLLLLGSMVFMSMFYGRRISSQVGSICLVFIIMVVVELGVNGFFYNKAVPLFASERIMEVTSLDKFLLAYFGSSGTSELSRLYLTRPRIITQLAVVKYVIFGTISTVFGCIFFNRTIIQRKIPKSALLPASMFCSAAIWLVMRLAIGSIAIDAIALPATVALLWMYRSDLDGILSVSYKQIAVVGIVLLLTANAALAGARISTGQVVDRNISSDTPENLELFLHKYESDETKIRTDVKTWFRIELFRHVKRDITRSSWDGEIKSLELKHVKHLLGEQSHVDDDILYIIDYERDKVALMNWVHLKTWLESREEIRSNTQINKIYSSGRAEIYNNAGLKSTSI
ncbi:hypothetical protein [Halogranum gelatinilyticum]|uniref:hypothetical protein n=1 Tax=Halogranum gelatinilyticum TaxID=660521 RepID=UPI0011140FC3|nr:hypothetical protein [Halogranum gelatinilyticum]